MGLHPCGASAKTSPGPKPKRRPTQPAVEHNRSWEEVALPKQQVDVPKLMPEQPITVPPKRLLVEQEEQRIVVPKLMPKQPITFPPKRLLVEQPIVVPKLTAQPPITVPPKRLWVEQPIVVPAADHDSAGQAQGAGRQEAAETLQAGTEPRLHIKPIAKRAPKRCKPAQQGKHRELVWRDTEALP